MFVFGLGLGSVMQVLVIAVQNAVEYKDLGAATSGVTYFRSIGGSFGTAVLGPLFSSHLTANIAHYLGALRLPAGVTIAALSPKPAGHASIGSPRRGHPRVRQLIAERVPGRGSGGPRLGSCSHGCFQSSSCERRWRPPTPARINHAIRRRPSRPSRG